MEKVMSIYHAVTGPEALVYWMCLFGVSESLALIPQVKANSVFQAVLNALGWMKKKIVK